MKHNLFLNNQSAQWKTVFTKIHWMILKIGSDFYNHLFYIQMRRKYSRKESWNNFEVNEIFQKTRKLKIIAFWSLWALREMQTLSKINWRNWRRLNSRCNSMSTRKLFYDLLQNYITKQIWISLTGLKMMAEKVTVHDMNIM